MALPDYVVIDLDPGNGPWSHLVEVARALRTLLEALELESYVKTSGKRGVHVVVPIAPGPTHAQATRFAEQRISLESILQKGRARIQATSLSRNGSENAVPVVLITYATTESAIRIALDAVTVDGHIAEPPQVIRIERD